MCLGIPMKVVKLNGEECIVSSEGLERRANLALVNGVKKGDYVILHAGFVIKKINEKEAMKTLEVLNLMRDIE